MLAGKGSPTALADGVGGQQGQQSSAGGSSGQLPTDRGGGEPQGVSAGGRMTSNSRGAAPQHQAWGQVCWRDRGGTFASTCRAQSIGMFLAMGVE